MGDMKAHKGHFHSHPSRIIDGFRPLSVCVILVVCVCGFVSVCVHDVMTSLNRIHHFDWHFTQLILRATEREAVNDKR